MSESGSRSGHRTESALDDVRLHAEPRLGQPHHGQRWSEAYVFFRCEDDGTAPVFAVRLMRIAGA